MPIEHDLVGRAAVVTGGSKGIGRRIAERLRDAGASVWVWDAAPGHLDGVDAITVDVTTPIRWRAPSGTSSIKPLKSTFSSTARATSVVSARLKTLRPPNGTAL